MRFNPLHIEELPERTKIQVFTRNTEYTFVITPEGIKVQQNPANHFPLGEWALVKIYYNWIYLGGVMLMSHPTKGPDAWLQTSRIMEVAVYLPDGTVHSQTYEEKRK
jgi:hypothetical protein